MRVHYFQRYHQKENVATANTMLLLSRIYSYNPSLFFEFLKSEFFQNEFEPEVSFRLQERSKESVPDALISQDSFKILIETKLSDWFYSDQLERHLEGFSDEKCKVLISLSSEEMNSKTRAEFEEKLREYNESKQTAPIIHVNTTFEKLANAISEHIGDRDYEIQELIEDYLDFCYHDKLIVTSDSWKWLRMQLAGTTLSFNIKENVYYDIAQHGFRPHDYIGLYSRKSVRAIGKLNTIIVTDYSNGEVEYEIEKGNLTEEFKEKIEKAIEDGKNYGYDLKATPHRFFFVEQFFETEYQKESPRGAMGTRYFDLSQMLNMESLPSTERIAQMLRDKKWS